MLISGTVALLIGCQQAEPRGTTSTTNRASGLNKQDELLLAAANVALPPPGIAASDLPEPNSMGAKLVGTYCAQCHNMPTPLMHSATDWPGVARRMWLRMGLLSPSLGIKVPTMAERFTMLDYLTTNALKVSGATLPAGRGREAFAEICSRCHALPDPRVHSSADWPAVFTRMEQNMIRMQVPPPTREQTSDLLLYLQTVASRQ